MAAAAKKKSKKGKTTLSLNSFLQGDPGSGGASGPGCSYVLSSSKQSNWADEMDAADNELDDYPYGMTPKPAVSRDQLPTAPRASRDPDVDLARVPTDPPFKAYLGNLPYDIDPEDIQEFFKDLKVRDVSLPQDGGRQKGFGYAEFEDRQSLIEALNMNDESLNNRKIRVDLAQTSDRDGGFGGRRRDDEDDRTEGDWRKKEDRPSGFEKRNERGGDRFGDRDRDRFGDRDRDRGGFGGRDSGFGRDREGGGGGESDDWRKNDGGGRDDKRSFGTGFGGSRDRDGFRGGDRDRDRGFGGRDSGFGRDRDGFGGGPPRDRDGFGGGPPRDRDGFGGGPPRDRDGYGPPRDRGDDRGERGPPRDGPSERPKLNLTKRTKPVETGAKPSERSSSIFGSAKPVDTAAKERAIEEKLHRRDTDHRVDRERDRAPPSSSRPPRRESSDSQDGQSVAPPPGAGSARVRRDSALSDEEVFSEDRDAKKAGASPPKPKDSKLVAAVPPKENIWEKRKTGSGSGETPQRTPAEGEEDPREPDREPAEPASDPKEQSSSPPKPNAANVVPAPPPKTNPWDRKRADQPDGEEGRRPADRATGVQEHE